MEFVVCEPGHEGGVGGMAAMNWAEVLGFFDDPDGWWAARHGMPRSLYVRWRRWIEAGNGDPICTGQRRNGARCSLGISAEAASPQAYTPGYSDRCNSHQGEAGAWTRKRLDDATRSFVLERDKGCGLCGAKTDEVDVHHWDGNPGNDELWNLIAVCGTCHRRLHGTTQEG